MAIVADKLKKRLKDLISGLKLISSSYYSDAADKYVRPRLDEMLQHEDILESFEFIDISELYRVITDDAHFESFESVAAVLEFMYDQHKYISAKSLIAAVT